MKGDRTEPCLTPNFIANISENILFHLTVEKKFFFSQLSRSSNNATGRFLFISFMNRA